MKRKLLPLLLTVITLFSVLAVPSYAAKAATITETVNLATISKNARGEGYYWANLDNTLTLEGLNIVTEDEFGMKIPKDATVILKGDNYISAASIGLVCVGHVTFEGSGSLTVVAGDVGIDCTSVYANNITRLRSGKINVTAGKTGIRLETADFSLMGSELKIQITGNDSNAKAIEGRNVSMSGGKLTANAGIYASNQLQITSLDAEITASGAALESPNGIRMTKVAIKAGADAASLAEVGEYNGESALKLTSTASNAKKGILFNADYPRFVDYIIFVVIILGVSALIAVPIYIKRKKTEKLIAEYKAAHPPKKSKTTGEKPASAPQSNKNHNVKKK
ncbi:MAG: hypothetical protein IKB34_07470 [Clostridia bacterium]|nr:hypothetical protein [Clostridia bacterium]